ncbi:MAG: dihydrolipoamide acetyltransferase family protein [Candidatus Marinimicrobia bacterium]|jgi:2-oxoglutarate dehydrogenase E2 component (dihydrolipoamide succinyltransferase)|nr:dihydrolipoamide acetyltransferase family protein [Candidatus Neomarinimicrobiota bacterium]MDP6569588.1 dihydrolipoamide acetyltransferase family protein [Candidatus Neomarinimicrobiota bacterium]MDP7025675.1 dihydrolipoamide acetyltransferase family protein [Candidatus Neomarinimicrobiota bacterium]|tara:strand:+ start:852 stop:2117 length:1266 start_codon:yes stop_codon:yes gene_type:complete
MIVDVIMPKLGESITEGTIIEWRKKAGDAIARDEILLEIGTDKVDSEIPSPAGGVVVELLVQEKDVVPVETVIARIETDGDAPEKTEEPDTETAKADVPDEKGESKVEEPPKKIPKPEISEKKSSAGRTFYTPLVRSIAEKEGISQEELAGIPGSGRSGRVTKKDVLAYLKSGREASAPAEPSRIPMTDEVVEMERMRQIIAQHMRKSLDTAAHVHVVSEADVTDMVEFCQKRRDQFLRQEGFKLTYTPFFIMAVVKAIQDNPIVNASLDGTTIQHHRNVNMGIAVAVEKGLIVPVIPKCEELNFLGLCRRVNDISIRARREEISPDELQGSTFSISNFGIFGNIYGTPIINQPNSAILGIGAVKKRPIVHETPRGDAIVIRSMTYLSLGFDHRLIDGAGGGNFLGRVVHYLENMDTISLL